MRKELVVSATLLLAVQLPWRVNASTFSFSFTGPGVSGTVQLTYGVATDGKYPQAFEVTGISGTFSDSNNGLNIVNASIGPLEPIKHDTPESTNLLAPLDFSRFAVATGLSPDNNGFLTYDNLFWPGGSPATARPITRCMADSSIFTDCSSISVAAEWLTYGATVTLAGPAPAPSITELRSRPKPWR